MQVKIKRVDKDIELPAYKTAGAAACDLPTRESVVIQPRSVALVKLNVSIELPKNHWGLLAARSSLPKRGLMLANSMGIFDEDFCVDEDEYALVLYNFTDQVVTIERGERLAQLLILPREAVEFIEVESLGNKKRGGFGTTGRV